MSILYYEPRAPEQVRFERLVWLILVAIVVVLGVVVFATDRGEPARGEVYTELRCASEDEVIVRLEEDAFDLGAGALFCVHLDYLKGDPE